jgi:hypothetical protein
MVHPYFASTSASIFVPFYLLCLLLIPPQPNDDVCPVAVDASASMALESPVSRVLAEFTLPSYECNSCPLLRWHTMVNKLRVSISPPSRKGVYFSPVWEAVPRTLSLLNGVSRYWLVKPDTLLDDASSIVMTVPGLNFACLE